MILAYKTNAAGDKVLIYRQGDSQRRLLEYDVEECACCVECCHEIDGGVFNMDGNLEYETAALTAVVEMPTPNERKVCNGEMVRITITLKASVPSESAYQYFYWLERDWYHRSHGPGGMDLHRAGDHWRVWQVGDRSQTLEVEWTECWMNYIQTYGDICFGVIAGVPGEVLTLTFTELPNTADCCLYMPVCKNCEYVLEDIGDPVGPEMIQIDANTRTYWYDFPNGWSVKLRVTGVDTMEHRFERGATVNVDIDVRPAKGEYARYLDFRTDPCVTALGWKDSAGEQFHPIDDPLDFEPALQCFPSSFEPNPDPCYERIRPPQPDTALEMAVSMNAAECIDECGDERIPESIIVEVALPSEGGDILTAIVAVTDCPEDDPVGEVCCDIICEHQCIVVAASFDHLAPGHVVPGDPLAGFTYPAGTTTTFQLVGHGIRTQDDCDPLPIRPLTFAWWVYSRCCKYLRGEPNPCPTGDEANGDLTEIDYILGQLPALSPTHIASCGEGLSCDTEPAASIVQQYFNFEFPCLVEDTDICNFTDETPVNTGIGNCCG